MRDANPGDLSVRIGFARTFGGGPDQGKVRPSIQITDGTSGKTMIIELTPELLTELMAGGEAHVTADHVSGFKGLRDFGKYHHMITQHVATRTEDYRVEDPYALPYVSEVVDDIEKAGYVCDLPRRNNKQQWVIVGRKYTESRDA